MAHKFVDMKAEEEFNDKVERARIGFQFNKDKEQKTPLELVEEGYEVEMIDEKPQTEQELKKQIEEYQKDNKNYYYNCPKCQKSWNNPAQIHCEDCHIVADKILIQEGMFKELQAELKGIQSQKAKEKEFIDEEIRFLKRHLIKIREKRRLYAGLQILQMPVMERIHQLGKAKEVLEK